MKRTLTQLNATKNTNHLYYYIIKSAICLLFFICMMKNINTISAQTNNCPEGDPLQWAWVQDIITGSDGIDIAAIHQFEYEGNTHFKTINADYENEPNSLYFNCEGELLCEDVSYNYSFSPCDDLNLFLAAIADFTILWSYEDPFPTVTCPSGEPLQWNWLQDLIAEAVECEGGTIGQFNYNGNTYYDVDHRNRSRLNCNFFSNIQRYYNCVGDEVCYYTDSWGGNCDSNFLATSLTANNIWSYEPSTPDSCLEGDPLQWEWMEALIEQSNGCAVGEIQQFEYNGLPYFQTVKGEPTAIPCDIDAASSVYNCEGILMCKYGGDAPFVRPCNQEIISASNNQNTIWTYELNPETCPQGDPLQWNWMQNIISNSDNCFVGKICQFEFNGSTFFQTIPGYGNYCPADITRDFLDCQGNWICSIGGITSLDWRCSPEIKAAANNNCTMIYEFGVVKQGNQMKCPENTSTSICAPVSMPASLTLQDFSTTDDPVYMNSMSMLMEEQIEVQKYFTTTTRMYSISDEAGNQKTCETKHHIANQFLQAPEVYPPGIVCQEDLWSYVKIGVDQYKIYNDHNGSKGEILSTCNTPSLICSTADLGVDTKVPDTYNFWASTYFQFPDGSICESEAMPFYVEVHPKPAAALNTSNKTIIVGGDIHLMDMVTSNKSGYWSGENILYLMTDSGENIAYFSANYAGVNKLYYTVSNGICDRSYLFIVAVDGASDKTSILDQAQKQVLTSFNIYPNPTTGKVFIDLPDEAVYQISLTNISGKVIQQVETNVEESTVEMDLSGLPKGMYLVELKNEQTQSIQKLVIE